MADDLYQEFFLAICETTDDRLIKAQREGYLDVLCVGMINNIWLKRDRVKSYDKGSTSPLYTMCNHIHSIDVVYKDEDEDISAFIEDILIDKGQEYDYDKDQRVQQANEFIQELIELKKESPDTTERFRSRVFYWSNYKYKNTRQFSKASGIPYNVCWEANNKFKQIIKININDLRPDSGF